MTADEIFEELSTSLSIRTVAHRKRKWRVSMGNQLESEGDPGHRGDPSSQSLHRTQSRRLAKGVGFSQAACGLGVTESNLRNWSHAVASRGTQAFAPLSQRTDDEAVCRAHPLYSA